MWPRKITLSKLKGSQGKFLCAMTVSEKALGLVSECTWPGSYTHFLQKKEPRKNISIQLDQMLGTEMLEEDKITKQINLRRKREAEQRF